MRVDARALCKISIHALRVEGDTVWQLDAQDDTGKVLDERYRVIVAF